MDKTIADYDQAIKLDPQDAGVYYTRAYIYKNSVTWPKLPKIAMSNGPAIERKVRLTLREANILLRLFRPSGNGGP